MLNLIVVLYLNIFFDYFDLILEYIHLIFCIILISFLVFFNYNYLAQNIYKNQQNILNFFTKDAIIIMNFAKII